MHLIDDDVAVRESLALLIGTVGLRVQTWSDPQAFLDSFDREGIGANVLDVGMPGISDLAVLDTLVAQGVDPPVILLAGHGTVDMCRRAFKAGVAEFLEKPVDDEPLLEALQGAVWQHIGSRQQPLADLAARERFQHQAPTGAMTGSGLWWQESMLDCCVARLFRSSFGRPSSCASNMSGRLPLELRVLVTAAVHRHCGSTTQLDGCDPLRRSWAGALGAEFSLPTADR